MPKTEAMMTYIEFVHELAISGKFESETESEDLDEILNEIDSYYAEYQAEVKSTNNNHLLGTNDNDQ